MIKKGDKNTFTKPGRAMSEQDCKLGIPAQHLDCFASLAKTDNTTAGQGETDCKLGFQPNNTTPSPRQRVGVRNSSHRQFPSTLEGEGVGERGTFTQ